MEAMSSRLVNGQVTIMGARFPNVTVGLAGTTLVATIVAANVPAILALLVMPPSQVWHGQVWRLLTWSLLEFQPLSLIFVCLAFLFFGRELANSWGALGFLKVCAGIVAATAFLTCLLALAVPYMIDFPFWSAWALGGSLIVAYALMFPGRTILLYFVLPLRGRNLLIATVAGTLLFALLSSFAFFVPHFIAQGLMYAYLRGYSPRMLWLRLKARAVRFRPARRPSYIREVDKEEPPRWLH